MPREYLVVDKGRSFSQDKWLEEKDTRGRRITPARPGREEIEITLRVDRQYRAMVRISKEDEALGKRQEAIVKKLSQYKLGEEIAPGVQIIEAEYQFTPAQRAIAGPGEKFTPSKDERSEVAFTLRINGRDLVKTALPESSLDLPGWEQTLAQKISHSEEFLK